MKSFQEAFKLVFVEVDQQKSLIDLTDRYDSIISDVVSCRDSNLDDMLLTLIRMVGQQQLDPKSAMLTVFLNGMIVGMEMEKGEFSPAVSLEPEGASGTTPLS